MYLIVAFAVTVMVIALAWRGVGAAGRSQEDRTEMAERPGRLQRPTRRAPTKFVAPDDDPEFLSEVDRRLRGEGKNN